LASIICFLKSPRIADVRRYLVASLIASVQPVLGMLGSASETAKFDGWPFPRPPCLGSSPLACSLFLSLILASITYGVNTRLHDFSTITACSMLGVGSALGMGLACMGLQVATAVIYAYCTDVSIHA
jgi:hypothetical protein